MRKFKGTQGQWFFSGMGGEILSMPSQVKICSRISGSDHQEATANGQLMSAAPVMMEALEKIADTSEDTGREGCTYGDTQYDSVSAAYGYNLCLQQMKDIADKALKIALYEEA